VKNPSSVEFQSRLFSPVWKPKEEAVTKTKDNEVVQRERCLATIGYRLSEMEKLQVNAVNSR